MPEDTCPYCGSECDESTMCLDVHDCRRRMRARIVVLEAALRKNDHEKQWAIRIPDQYVSEVFSTKDEAETAAKVLVGIKHEVTNRPHGPEQCWCGDDHSP